MARPIKPGLAYFPRDVDYYSDYKIMDLLDEYGPLGQTVYDVLLCMIYREGYYLQLPIQRLASQIGRRIGTRWISKKGIVEKILKSCVQLGLLDKDLQKVDVYTSVGIQRRYQAVTARRKTVQGDYWLLEDTDERDPVTKGEITAAEMPTAAYKTQDDVDNNATNKTKQNKTIQKERKPSQPLAPFLPPSIKDVDAYCLERGNSVKGESFVNYYQSKGWMMGATSMRDWKAAVRTWETNSFSSSRGKSVQGQGFVSLTPSFTKEDLKVTPGKIPVYKRRGES